jgi:hypothetical protein
MVRRLTIQLAVEEFELFDLYSDIIDSYSDDLDDPSLSDLYDLVEEYDEEFEFYPNSEGDFSSSFEKNLREAIATIIETTEELTFVDDEFEDDEIPEIYGDEFDQDVDGFDLGMNGEDDPYED